MNKTDIFFNMEPISAKQQAHIDLPNSILLAIIPLPLKERGKEKKIFFANRQLNKTMIVIKTVRYRFIFQMRKFDIKYTFFHHKSDSVKVIV